MDRSKTNDDDNDIMNRIRNFLPQIRTANEDLEASFVGDDSDEEKEETTSAVLLSSTHTVATSIADCIGDSTRISAKSSTEHNRSSRTRAMQLDADLQLDNTSSSSSSDSEEGEDDDNETTLNVTNDNNRKRLIEEVLTKEGKEKSNIVKVLTDNDQEKSKSSIKRKKTAGSATAAPTIQLHFTLGDMTHNPLMKLLADNDDSENDDDDDNDIDIDDIDGGDGRMKVISKLLLEPEKEIKSEPVLKMTSKKANASSAAKRSLITEIK